MADDMLCLNCIGEKMAAEQDRDKGVTHNGAEPVIPEIRIAVTLAPMWVSQQMGTQMVMSCVAVPSCMQHLAAQKESPIQRATRSGLMLGGQSPQ